MFKKHVITSLVVLGLLATSISPAFAEDDQTGETNNDGSAVTTDTAAKEDDQESKENDEAKDEVEAKEVDLVCMQTAVEKRDNAVIGALDTFYANVKTALTARRDSVKAAWGVEDPDARKAAIRKAWKDFRGTWKSEKKALKKAKKVAWKQFKEDREVCGGEGEGTGESEGSDVKF